MILSRPWSQNGYLLPQQGKRSREAIWITPTLLTRVSRWLQRRLESVRIGQSGGEEEYRACAGRDYGDAAYRRRRGGAHLLITGGTRRQGTGGLQGRVDADRSGDRRGAFDFTVGVGGGYARQRGERLPPSGAWRTGGLLHQRASTQALRGQRQGVGPSSLRSVEDVSREVCSHVQRPTSAPLGSETPRQLLVHRFGVLVCSQHRALFGLRVIQLDQEPLARIVVSQLFQGTVHNAAPLAIHPLPLWPCTRNVPVSALRRTQLQVYTREQVHEAC